MLSFINTISLKLVKHTSCTVIENYNFKAYREKRFDNNSISLYGSSIVKNAILFGYKECITALNVVILKKTIMFFSLIDKNCVE